MPKNGEIMKKIVRGGVVNTKTFFSDNKITLIFITFFTVGISIGALSLGLFEEKSIITLKLIEKYFNENSSLSIIELMSRNVLSSLIYLFIIYCCGLCAIGLPIIAIIPLIKGISIGMIISYQYIFNEIKGFLYSLNIIFLPTAIFVCILNFAYCEGINMSIKVSGSVFNLNQRDNNNSLTFIKFTKRFIIFAVAIIIISLIEALLTGVFSKYY